MSYNGTVRCSVCHHLGHNKAGCETHKKTIADRRATYGDDDYYVAQFDAKHRARKVRTCSYCGGEAHTRRTCAKLEVAKESFRMSNAEYRQNVRKSLQDAGIGIGAMIQFESYNGEKEIEMVTGFQWANVNMNEKTEDFIFTASISRLGNPAYIRRRELPRSITDRRYSIDYKVVVPVKAGRPADVPPADFLSGKLGLKRMFTDKRFGLNTLKDRWGGIRMDFDASDYSTSVKGN